MPSETKRTLEGVGHDSSFLADGKTADQEIVHSLPRDDTKESKTSHELTLSLTTSPPKEGTSCLSTGNLLPPPWDETSSLNPHESPSMTCSEDESQEFCPRNLLLVMGSMSNDNAVASPTSIPGTITSLLENPESRDEIIKQLLENPQYYKKGCSVHAINAAPNYLPIIIQQPTGEVVELQAVVSRL